MNNNQKAVIQKALKLALLTATIIVITKVHTVKSIVSIIVIIHKIIQIKRK